MVCRNLQDQVLETRVGKQCYHFWSELAGLGPNSELFGKIGPEFDYPTFSLGINTLKEQGSQVVKLFAESLILSNFWSDFGLICS